MQSVSTALLGKAEVIDGSTHTHTPGNTKISILENFDEEALLLIQA